MHMLSALTYCGMGLLLLEVQPAGAWVTEVQDSTPLNLCCLARHFFAAQEVYRALSSQHLLSL